MPCPVRDPYEVLGVPQDADAAAIKQAFRRLAREHHPDRNPDDADAQKRFQELNAAYQVLSDPETRARYDRMGSEGPGPGRDGFGSIEDWLSEILTGGFGGSARETGDLREVLELEFEEAALGCKRSMTYERVDSCNSCGGDGAAAGSQFATCGTCRGAGRVRLGALGWISLGMDRACPQCNGRGRVPLVPCAQCKGKGLAPRRSSVEVNVPAGIEPGTTQVVIGGGSRVSPESPPGDLELVVRVKPHPEFTREANDVHSDVAITFVTAALGGEVAVKTLYGPTALRIPAGTQPGDLLELRNKGIPHRFRSGVGNHVCRIRVTLPRGLSPRGKELVQEFDRELEQAASAGLFERLKGMFS